MKKAHHTIPPEIRPKRVGARLLALKNAWGITSTEVCHALNIDRSAYTKYEKGERALPPYVAFQFSEYYGITLDYLLVGKDEHLTLEVARRLGIR